MKIFLLAFFAFPLQLFSAGASLTLSGWPKIPAGAKGYNIYMSATSGRAYKKMTELPITESSYTVNNLEAGKKYYFVLTMVTESGGRDVESVPSAEWSLPAGSEAAQASRGGTDGWILVKGWGMPRPGQAYNLYMAETSGKGFKKINSQPIRDMNFLAKNLEPGKIYYFIMTVVSEAKGKPQESRPSQEWSVSASAGPLPK